MKDEIKEILDLLKYCVDKNEYLEEPNMKNWKPLLDYITNLQEEKERQSKAQVILDDENAELQGKITELQEENERLKVNCNIGNENLTFYRNSYKDYKSRIDKAVEYIENNEDFETEIFDCNTGGCLGTDLSIQAKTLLNILKGEDK